jgi:hypothetical protein
MRKTVSEILNANSFLYIRDVYQQKQKSYPIHIKNICLINQAWLKLLKAAIHATSM